MKTKVRLLKNHQLFGFSKKEQPKGAVITVTKQKAKELIAQKIAEEVAENKATIEDFTKAKASNKQPSKEN